MSLQRQYPAGDRGAPDRFEGPFVGRGEHLRAFAHAIEAQEPEDLRVLVYHGIGGIGKSRIADELGRMLDGESSKAEDMDLTPDPAPGSQFCWAKIDFEVSRRRKPALGLYHLRTRLSGKYGFHFPTFDLAFAQYWSKAYPEAPLPKPDPSFLEEHGDFALALLDAVGEVPVAGLLAKIPKHVNRLGEKAMDLYRKRNVEALQGVSALPAHQIEECLPRLWTYDFKNQISKAERRAVIFFDTYEALREDQSAESKRHQADRWIRKFVKRLPGTLIVVTGHEKLYWPEVTKDWETVIQQRHLQELTSSHARSFLKDSVINEEAIRDHIVENVSGIPFDWVWPINLYREMRRRDEEPTPKDFGETPWELSRRFFRYLQDDEMAMLELLAVPRTFNRAIVEALAENFDPGFPIGQFNRLKRFAFVNRVDQAGEGKDTYAVHDRAPDAIREHGPFLPGQERVHEFLFNHHAETLEDLKPREIKPPHEQALREAFYHGGQSLGLEELGQWFFGASEVFNQAARWQVLMSIYEKLLDLQKTGAHDTSSIKATTLDGLGTVYRELGRYEEAERLYEQAHEIWSELANSKNRKLATTKNNLALLYRKQGKYEDAEFLYQQALKIRSTEFGEDSIEVAETLNNLALIHQKQGHYKKSEHVYRRALEVREYELEDKDRRVAESYNNLAVLIHKRGYYDRAEDLYERALSIRELIFGDQHPRVGSTLNNFGELYRQKAKYDRSKRCHIRSLKIKKKAYGERHPTVATSLYNYALLHDSLGKYERAKSLCERAFRLQEQSLGEKHPRLGATLSELATLFRKLNNYDKAGDYYERAFEILGKALRKGHPRIAEVLNDRAVLHRKQGGYGKAESLFERALEIRNSSFRKDHPRIAETQKELALLYDKQEQQNQAARLLEQALEIARKELGQTHPKTREMAASLKAVRDTQ